MTALKVTADYSNFSALDIRIGRIVKVEVSQSTKPTYRMTIDFGADIGTKVSCGAYRHYTAEELVGRQIVGVVNFPPRKMGPEVSEVLVLGAANPEGQAIFLTPQSELELGSLIF